LCRHHRHDHCLPDDKTLQELEEKFDPEMRFARSVPPATQMSVAADALSCFHYYTAGFGLLQESRTAACTWPSCWG
jgi:hypothetical protein